MSALHDQIDYERGQEGPLIIHLQRQHERDEKAIPFTTAPSTAPRTSKTALLWAICSMGALLMASTIHHRPSTTSQDHRRLTTTTQQSRHLSTMSRVGDFFNVIFVSSAYEEDAGFGKPSGFDMNYDQSEEIDQCPGKNMGFKSGLYNEVPRIWSPEMGMFGIDDKVFDARFPERNFAVEPEYTVLENGVRFNVEEVPDALPQDRNKTRLSQEDVDAALRDEASAFYDIQMTIKTTSRTSRFLAPPIEVSSRIPIQTKDGGGTVFASGQGFLAACMTAFAHHLPLALSPDDLWTVVINGFARHVDRHADELRHHFVAHQGQMDIRIREDSMVKGKSRPEDWQELIFPQFVEGMAQNVNNSEVFETLAIRNFTTSTVESQAASSVILMATMKNYFNFRMDTMCGIPNVRLDGTREDWVSLIDRTNTLAQYMLQNNTHGDLWIYDIVLPILDEFLKAYDGTPSYCFWQNMVKFRSTGSGSGSFDFLSGWLHTLFPYLSSGGDESRPNPYLKPWLESASAHLLGPKPDEIPPQMSSVPVQWMYYGEEYPMHFHAGFRGVQQEADGTVSPIIGWYVTEDP